MPKRKVLVGDDDKTSILFLSEYFSDTKSIPIFAQSKPDVLEAFVLKPDFVFIRIDWLDGKLTERMNRYRQENPAVRFFSLGYAKDEMFKWDNQFEAPLEIRAFRKTLLGELEFPSAIRLLAVDDEEGILEIIKDFFELRKNPRFQVQIACDGLEGFKCLQKEKPDCLILDIKMPVRSGIDVYRDLKRLNYEIPTIVFVDSTSADEIAKIRKHGDPVFVEKSGSASSMPEMLLLVKKLVYFA